MRSAGNPAEITASKSARWIVTLRRAVELLALRIERRALQGSAVVPTPLMRAAGAYPVAQQALAEAEPDQDARGVRPHVDAAADMGQGGRLFVDIDLEPGAAQRQRGGEPADAGADHGDAQRLPRHVRLVLSQ
jgi:hypothetical protein